jgi:hypothetical protein
MKGAAIVRKDTPTKNEGWIARRANQTANSIWAASVFVTAFVPHDGVYAPVQITDCWVTTDGYTHFIVAFDPAWSDEMIEKFLIYMKNSKKVCSALLTTDEKDEKIQVCHETRPKNPQPATSATC